MAGSSAIRQSETISSDPVKRADRLRQRHGLIVKGKRISCPPHYAPPNNDYDPPHHDYEHGFPLIRSLRASAHRSTSVLFSFVLFLVDHRRIICHPAIKNDSGGDPVKRAVHKFTAPVCANMRASATAPPICTPSGGNPGQRSPLRTICCVSLSTIFEVQTHRVHISQIVTKKPFRIKSHLLCQLS